MSIPNGNSSVPIVITTQEDKGTIYAAVHVDEHPQLLIENSCPFKIVIGQADESGESILSDSSHFTWACKIDSGAAYYYSLPTVACKLPDSPPTQLPNVFLLSALPSQR